MGRLLCVVKMLKVGVFLGQGAEAGGMLQYAKKCVAVLDQNDDIDMLVATSLKDCKKFFSLENLDKVMYVKIGLLERLIILFCLAIGGGAFFRKQVSRILPSIRKINATAVDLWFFPSQDYLGCFMDSATVNTIHDLMHRYEPTFPEVSSHFRGRLRDNRYQGILETSSLVLVDSDTGENQVRQSYSRIKALVRTVHYSPPDYIYLNPPADFDAKYDLPKDFLLYPAQFWAHKNHARLLEALSIVKERYSDVNLVFIGGSAEKAKRLKAQASTLGLSANVFFYGYVPDEDISGFYKRSRGLIFPSHFGPTNIPPLEAAICQVPFAVSDVYGMREQSGHLAFYFDPRNVTDMANACELLWSDNEQRELKLTGLTTNQVDYDQCFRTEFLDAINILRTE